MSVGPEYVREQSTYQETHLFSRYCLCAKLLFLSSYLELPQSQFEHRGTKLPGLRFRSKWNSTAWYSLFFTWLGAKSSFIVFKKSSKGQFLSLLTEVKRTSYVSKGNSKKQFPKIPLVWLSTCLGWCYLSPEGLLWKRSCPLGMFALKPDIILHSYPMDLI